MSRLKYLLPKPTTYYYVPIIKTKLFSKQSKLSTFNQILSNGQLLLFLIYNGLSTTFFVNLFYMVLFCYRNYLLPEQLPIC